ncbi:MAG: phosphate acyltransferase PlsX [Clostridia bacterium]|nr:phosphate acyltransferase PlsX [Clostridia bacterium]
MEILIDVFGSDENILTPVIAACNMCNKVESNITLVGKKQEILDIMYKKYVNESENIINRIGILDSKDYITNNDEPVWAIKNKKESSIVVAYDYMKTHSNVVFISAGSTGSIMAGALLKLGRIRGIHRPALITILPTLTDKKVILLDSGANPQARDVSILQYAKLGEIYCKTVLNVSDPKIALLNIGEEEEKGTPELKDIYKKLKQSMDNFVGNIEARYILNGDIDVVVCDGLVGNIALKSIEGAAKTLKTAVSNSFKTGIINKLKGLIIKSVLTEKLKKYDYKENGGAVLLGVNEPVIKVHGSSNIATFEKAIIQAQNMLENKIIEKIKENL